MLEKLMHSKKESTYWVVTFSLFIIIPVLMGIIITLIFKGSAPAAAVICGIIYAIFMIRLIFSNS
jgi:hypothetical protein